MTDNWRAVAPVGALKAGDVIAAEVDGVAIAIGRDGDHYFAVQRRCAHRGGDLADGIIARGHLVCPQHGWRFSSRTGCQEENSAYCLTTYDVRITDGQIEVDPTPRPRAEAGGAP